MDGLREGLTDTLAGDGAGDGDGTGLVEVVQVLDVFLPAQGQNLPDALAGRHEQSHQLHHVHPPLRAALARLANSPRVWDAF
ncbi:hypothetical protein B8W67_19130 [Mycolicibacillus koreensis]|uniref:Uncharacterized protein n=1 Tax=Mycolicibacillus koreensis TaxID=1069220 RepID=A0AA91PB24_9MYCO|nr:hypothetical protein B8W67_19130 [Mycolicibacillus koreensis]